MRNPFLDLLAASMAGGTLNSKSEYVFKLPFMLTACLVRSQRCPVFVVAH
jgi:hypothetical protein